MTENKNMEWELVVKGPNNENEELWRLKVSGGWIIKQYTPQFKNVSICFVPMKKQFVDVNILKE